MMQQPFTVTDSSYGGYGTFTATIDDCRTARHLGGGWLEIAGQRVGHQAVRDLITAVARANGGIYLYYPIPDRQRDPFSRDYEVRIGTAPVIDPTAQQAHYNGWSTELRPRASQIAGDTEDLWPQLVDMLARGIIPERPDEDNETELGIGEDHGDNVHVNRRTWIG